MKKIILILIFAVISINAQSRIFLDEEYSDWDNVTDSYADAKDDGTAGNIDLGTMWIANDENYLYLRVETGIEINATDNNYLTLYIDADNDTSTGKKVDGIGAEVEYIFGRRGGFAYLNGEEKIYHEALGFIASPTVSSSQLEFALRRDASISGSPLFTHDTIKAAFIAYKDNSLTEALDKAPDNGGIEFIFREGNCKPFPEYSIDKKDDSSLRIMSYNIERDGLIEKESTITGFSHIFKAINPEIIGFCEVYKSSSQDVADKINFFLPPKDGEQWYHAKNDEEGDIVLLSHFPILKSTIIHSEVGHDASGAFLVDLKLKFNKNILLIVCHPKCCSSKGDEDDKRQNQVDAVMEFIRKAKAGEGEFAIAENTPIVIMGDMNFVGSNQQRKTLLTGDIINNNTYGEDLKPDWDGSNLVDSRPYVTNTGMTFTTNSGSYPSGRLDYMIYTGSVMRKTNSFILDTQTLPEEALSKYGLSADDTEEASDHLPVVVDFELEK